MSPTRNNPLTPTLIDPTQLHPSITDALLSATHEATLDALNAWRAKRAEVTRIRSAPGADPMAEYQRRQDLATAVADSDALAAAVRETCPECHGAALAAAAEVEDELLGELAPFDDSSSPRALVALATCEERSASEWAPLARLAWWANSPASIWGPPIFTMPETIALRCTVLRGERPGLVLPGGPPGVLPPIPAGMGGAGWFEQQAAIQGAAAKAAGVKPREPEHYERIDPEPRRGRIPWRRG